MGKQEIVRFALGCFWQPEVSFGKLPGVVQTRVGYSGGTTENPTYTNLGDHTETVEVTFDPKKISYEALLEHFWAEHDATMEMKTQYKSAIFAMDQAQQTTAEQSKDERQTKLKKRIVTEIQPAGEFYEAEDYHQKYLAKCGLA